MNARAPQHQPVALPGRVEQIRVDRVQELHRSTGSGLTSSLSPAISREP
jgi:hypothetical protein